MSAKQHIVNPVVDSVGGFVSIEFAGESLAVLFMPSSGDVICCDTGHVSALNSVESVHSADSQLKRTLESLGAFF